MKSEKTDKNTLLDDLKSLSKTDLDIQEQRKQWSETGSFDERLDLWKNMPKIDIINLMADKDITVLSMAERKIIYSKTGLTNLIENKRKIWDGMSKKDSDNQERWCFLLGILSPDDESNATKPAAETKSSEVSSKKIVLNIQSRNASATETGPAF